MKETYTRDVAFTTKSHEVYFDGFNTEHFRETQELEVVDVVFDDMLGYNQN